MKPYHCDNPSPLVTIGDDLQFSATRREQVNSDSHAREKVQEFERLWLEDDFDDQEQSSILSQLEITKTLTDRTFDQRLAKHKAKGANTQEPATFASNLFSMDPNVGIAVNFGKLGGRTAYAGGTNRPRPSLLRTASIGDFPGSALPTRRCSLQFHSEHSCKPTRTIDVDCTKEKQLVIPYQRLDTEANEPHPSLEYPPLYFIIKKHPWLLHAIKSLYLFRWRVSYPLQRRVPASRYFRKIGVHFTWGELLLILPFFALVAIGTLWSFLYPSPSTTGQVSRLPLIFCFATALHNSFLSLLLGMPCERALWYHKLAGRVAFINGILHTYVCYVYPDDDLSIKAAPSGKYANVKFAPYLTYDTENISGTAILALVTGILITSVPYVRHKCFELFYYAHVMFAGIMAGCAFYHSGKIVPILVSATWGIDLIIRKLIMAAIRYPKKAQTRLISSTVVELRFPKIRGFDFNPGQYVYLCIPELSLFEWHPFSISSSPGQTTVTLHIRKAGNWTSALHELSQTKEEIGILVEGPFGNVGVDLTSSRYSFVMLISGGIGITPMQSICNQLIHEHGTRKRSLKKLSFLWMERDPIVMSDVEVVRRSSSAHFDTIIDDDSSVISDLEEGLNHCCRVDFPMSLASTFLAHVPPSRMPDSNFEYEYDSDFESEEILPDGTAARLANFLAVINDMPPAIARRLSMGRTYDHRQLGAASENSQPTIGGKLSADRANCLGRRNSNKSIDRQSEHKSLSSIDCNFPQKPGLGREGSMMSLGHLSDSPVYDDRDDGKEFVDDDTFLDAAYTQATDTVPTDVLDMQVYLTSKDPNSCFGNLPFVHEGRPDIKSKFLQMREEAIAAGETRVAVCVCAPAAIVAICQKASIKFSNHQVRFDFHSEMFG